MDGHHIYPAEIAILLLYWSMPPFLLSATLQWWFLRRNGASALRTFAILLSTSVISLVLVVALTLLGSGFLPSGLGMRDIWIGRERFEIFPIAYIAYSVVAFGMSWLGVHGLRRA